MPSPDAEPLSEKRRGFHRIVTNYGRLIATMAMGIATVPLQIAWLGFDGFGLLGLIASSVGIGAMLEDMMRNSMVRELGAAWHQRDDGKFHHSYAAAFRICVVVAILTAIVFGIIIAVLPLLNIRPEWVAPAQWITGCEGLATVVIVLASPAINMLVVREYFFWHNLWTVLRRSSYLIATIIPFFILGITTDLPKGLMVFGTIILIINVSVTLLLIIGFLIRDRRMTPSLRGSTPEAMKKVAGTFGWNSGIVVAMNLHERVANFIMNIFFGLWGNAVFSLALRLVSYIRMAGLGLTFGLDSVSARLSSIEDHSTLQAMFKHTTKMLSFVAFPSMVVVFVMAEPLLRMWVGRSIENPSEVLPQAEILVKIMVFGLAFRTVSDGWMKLFYGAGFIRKYAPYVLAGGLFNPILAIIFIYLLPKNSSYTGAAIAYSTVFLFIHMFVMPKVSASNVQLTLGKILQPMYRPLCIAIAVSPTLFVSSLFSHEGMVDWKGVIVGIACYGAAYVLCSWLFLLNKSERKSITAFISQRGD